MPELDASTRAFVAGYNAGMIWLIKQQAALRHEGADWSAGFDAALKDFAYAHRGGDAGEDGLERRSRLIAEGMDIRERRHGRG